MNEYAIEVLENELSEITVLAGDNPEYHRKIKDLQQAIKQLSSDEPDSFREYLKLPIEEKKKLMKGSL